MPSIAQTLAEWAVALDPAPDDLAVLRDLPGTGVTVWRHFGVAEQGSFVLLDAKGTKVYSAGSADSKRLATRVAAVGR